MCARQKTSIAYPPSAKGPKAKASKTRWASLAQIFTSWIKKEFEKHVFSVKRQNINNPKKLP